MTGQSAPRSHALVRLWVRLLRFGFWLLYNPFAFTYDWVSKAVSFGEWRCWGRTALRHLPEAGASAGGRVLEIAYGTGDIQLDLHAAGWQTYGHDLSPHMARIARHKLRRAGYVARLSRGQAQRLPYPSRTFDAVISTFPAEFILAPQTLAEVARVLRDDGRFIIVPNAILTGKDAATKGIEALYRITGQRSDRVVNLRLMFEPHGLTLDIHAEPCQRSVASVIVATRRGAPAGSEPSLTNSL